MALSLVRLRQIRKGDSLNDQLSSSQIAGINGAAVTQDEYQNGILSQLNKIIHGNNVGNWNDNLSNSHIFSLQELSDGRLFFAYCLATEVEGDLVRISGADTGNFANVTKVNPNNQNTMPVIGMIVEKINSTTCIVQSSGFVNLSAFTSLIPGKRYFVGLNGNVSSSVPNPSSSPTNEVMVQIVGVARGTQILELVPTTTMTKIKL